MLELKLFHVSKRAPGVHLTDNILFGIKMCWKINFVLIPILMKQMVINKFSTGQDGSVDMVC